jgi:hypothetical protein
MDPNLCYICFILQLLHNGPETPASENGIGFTQQMCQILILFHKRLYDKKIKEIKNGTIFSCSGKYRFSFKGKAYKIKIHSVECAFQDLQACSSTQFTDVKKIAKISKVKIANFEMRMYSHMVTFHTKI